MITYKETDKSIKVFLENRLIGEIKTVKEGFQYFPNKHKQGGEVFKSINLVKKSLEE